MRHARRSIPTLFALAALAASAGAASAYEDEEIPCASYITSGEDDEPIEGFLIGTEDVTLTTSGGGSLGADVKVVELRTGGEVVKTVEYEVGYYQVDGDVYVIDCRSYKLIGII